MGIYINKGFKFSQQYHMQEVFIYNIFILYSGTSDHHHVTNHYQLYRLFNYRPAEGVYALCGSGYVEILGFGDLKLRLKGSKRNQKPKSNYAEERGILPTKNSRCS